MDSFKVYVFSTTQEGVEEISNQILYFKDFEVVGSSYSLGEAIKKIEFLKPSILIIDFKEIPEIEDISRLISEVKKRSQETFIVVLLKRGMTYNMRILYQEGADDFLYKPLEEQALLTIKNNYIRKRTVFRRNLREERRRSKVLSFLSPKGGTGKTFIASNVAIGLSNLLKKKVLYIDCSFPFSDLPILMDLSYSNKNLFDLVSLLSEGAKENIDDYLFYMESCDLYFLLPPKTLSEASYIFSHSVELSKALTYVKDFFDYLIVDFSPRYYDIVPELVNISDYLFSIVTSEANSIILHRQYKEELMKQGIPFDPRVIMNRRNKNALSLIGNELRTILPEGVFATVEEDVQAVSTSYNKGIPLILHNTKSRTKVDLINLVKAIAQVVENG